MEENEEMKKRLFALATALVMTLSMGMTVFASESPVINDTPDQETSGKFAESAIAVIDGKTVELDFTWRANNMYALATEKQKEQLDYYMPNDLEIVHARTRDLFEQIMGYRNEEVVYNDYFGLSLPSGYTMPAEGVEVTINAPYVGKDDYKYYIFHCKEDGTWEYIPTTEGDGTLSGRFTSFSPVFIMRIPKASVPTTEETPSEKDTTETLTTVPETTGGTTTTTTATAPVTTATAPATTTAMAETSTATSTTKAPKTGDFTGIYAAGMMALMSTAGIVGYIKKQREVR